MRLLRALRHAARVFARAYKVTQPSSYRRNPVQAELSQDSAYLAAAPNLRQWGVASDENDPHYVGVMDELLNRIVGDGIHIQPTPTTRTGTPLPQLHDQLVEFHAQWGETADVTGELPYGEVQRLRVRSWLGQGEHFVQYVAGRGRSRYPFAADEIPFRLELLEPDMIPWDLEDEATGVRFGVQLDGWRRPRAYRVYTRPPGDMRLMGSPVVTLADTVRVEASRIGHIKFVRRWPSTRGVPLAHAAFQVFDDVRDYLESERIAARIAATLAAAIERDPEYWELTDQDRETSQQPRSYPLVAGAIFDPLLPGESVSTIESKRPAGGLEDFRKSSLRTAAAATGTRYSAIARDFSGSYSSARQELAESEPNYARLRNYFIARAMRPTYQRLIAVGVLDGQITIPRGADLRSITRAQYIAPRLPWIDPLKETQADVLAIENGIKSREQVIWERGGDPRLIDEWERPQAPAAPPREDQQQQEDAA